MKRRGDGLRCAAVPMVIGPVAADAREQVVESGVRGRYGRQGPALCRCLFSGVIHVWKVLLEKAYGMTDSGLSVPLRRDDRLRIASLSRQGTVTAIAVLMDKGRLAPNTRLSRVLPGSVGKSGPNRSSAQPAWTGGMMDLSTCAATVGIE